MKAIVYRKYGPPEVAQVAEIPMPVPRPDELLVRVHTSTVNRTDSGFRSAEYFISRFWSGLFRPKIPVLGCEFSGTVTEIGKEVTQFKPGDLVFGYNDKTFGGHAEFLTIAQHEAVATLPAGMDLAEAAAMTEGAHYALEDIRAARVKAGQNVLVYGATGAIGSAAVQLLKHFGARVTAVCNTQNVDLVRGLGADTVIDYTKEDFTRTDTKFAFIFDAVGKSSFRQCKPLLTPKGIYISTELGKNGVNIPLALLTPLGGGKRLLFPLPTICQADVLLLKQLAEEGKFKPVIDRTYDMDRIVEAYHYVQSGQKTGNVLLRIGG